MGRHYDGPCDNSEPRNNRAACRPAADPFKDLCPAGSYAAKVCGTPIKKSMSFLTSQELFSYKAIPFAAAVTYLATSVGTTACQETFVQ
ncbi:hypothetical protein EB796_020254 [Bugula neritina]|uniref:Uncharacterized protein n=1 Tax=Bugula neritina TaxID=10212 RepID=A0A7J7J6A1_BUGNE|nr:hypothetical protein EB796_020254 [Bugula neritina]